MGRTTLTVGGASERVVLVSVETLTMDVPRQGQLLLVQQNFSQPISFAGASKSFSLVHKNFAILKILRIECSLSLID